MVAELQFDEPSGPPPEIIVVVPGKPATGSFRFTKTGHRFTPETVSDWRAAVRLKVQEAIAEKIPEGVPVQVTIIIRKPRPKAHPKKSTSRVPCPWARVKKPDCDNVTKPIKDALKTVAFHDDAQVTDLIVRKRWGDAEEVEIRFRAMTEDEFTA